MAATVATQGMNSICVTRNASAAAGVSAARSMVPSVVWLEVPNSTPSVAIEFSLATMLLSSATIMRQSRPIQWPTGSRSLPIAAR